MSKELEITDGEETLEDAPESRKDSDDEGEQGETDSGTPVSKSKSKMLLGVLACCQSYNNIMLTSGPPTLHNMHVPIPSLLQTH